MPIPVVNDFYAAQVIFKGKSGTPADVYTNTFYFRNDDGLNTPDEFADSLEIDLEYFYNIKDPGVVGGTAIASNMSSAVIQPQAEVRVYDLGNPAPRYPMIRFFDLVGLNAGSLPSEVCACLSYVAGQNQPRSRGRIYLGPLSNTTITVVDGRATVASNLRIGALAAARRLANVNTHSWSIWSPTDQQMKAITGGWMDNAFDTQRRRGEEATTRETFGQYLGMSGTPVTIEP